MRVQLICHGMMLFWYRKPTKPNKKDDGYTILLPQRPSRRQGSGHGSHDAHDGHDGRETNAMDHEIRLGVGAGAKKSVIGYPKKAEATKFYTLDFSYKNSSKERKPKNALRELMVYRANAEKAVPHTCKDAVAGVSFAIDIPYPLREEPVRIARYKQDPYADGDAVQNFEIHPRRIIGARVFSFEVDKGKKGIWLRNQYDPKDKHKLVDEIKGDVKIHLYSQPRLAMPNSGHLPAFNEMLRFKQKGLGLELNKHRCAEIDPCDLPRPDGLDIVDILHLHELNVHLHDMTTFSSRGIDPAECNQGGGC